MRDRMHESGQRDAPKKHQFQQGQKMYYISPYHDNPVDFEKYDDGMNTTETTDKSDGHRKSEVRVAKRKLCSKAPSRPLATGCAADFELFGRK